MNVRYYEIFILYFFPNSGVLQHSVFLGYHMSFSPVVFPHISMFLINIMLTELAIEHIICHIEVIQKLLGFVCRG